MPSTRATALKPPKFNLSDDESYESVFEHPASFSSSPASNLVPESFYRPPEKNWKYAILNKACSLLQNPPGTLSLKPLATMTDVDQQFLHILAWNVRLLDSDTISRFDSNDLYHINAPHNDQADYLGFLWAYMTSADPPIPQAEELMELQPVADAIILYLRQHQRRKAEDARKRMWDSIAALQSDLSVFLNTLRQAEELVLLDPDKPQIAF